MKTESYQQHVQKDEEKASLSRCARFTNFNVMYVFL